jgi:large subunit ribosomal protein L4
MADKKDEKTAAKATAKKTTAAKATTAKSTDAKATAAKKKTAPVRRAVARPIARTVRPATAPAPREEEPAAAPKKREAHPLPTAPAGEVALIGADGSVLGSLPLPAGLVTAKRRAGVLFQSLMASASNTHLGTAATKNRSRVRGGGAKPWRQKGTGRARQGSTRAPHWRHGGVVFGPNGRRYGVRIPEKMRREAFAEAFAACAADGRVLVYEGLEIDGERPRTAAVVGWLGKIGDTGRALLVTGEVDQKVAVAAANAKDVGLRSVGALRTRDLLTHDTVLVQRAALDALVARASVGSAE